MTRIFVVRHGETDGNLKKIYRGRWDLPLNATGEQQVKKAGAALKPFELTAIYQSPLLRTKQTAVALAEHQAVTPQDDGSLIDIDYGEWTKIPDAEVANKYPDLYDLWKKSPHRVVFPSGEGLADVRKRIEPGLRKVAESHNGKNIALVSHRVPIKVILCAALGLDDSAFWRIQVDAASISVLDFAEGVFSLVFSNETCHLGALGDKLGAADF
jgi:broad specificity phosphatase PhoE